MSRRAPVAVFAGLLVLLALGKWLPFLSAERAQVASTPVVRPDNTAAELRLAAGQQACVDGVEFSPRAQEALLRVTYTAGAGPPIALTARAPGYRADATGPSGYGTRASLEIAFAPSRTTLPRGRLCLRNAGSAPVGLLANDRPRTQAARTVTLDGKPTPTQPVITLQERDAHPLTARAGTLFDHVEAFRPFPVGPLLLWCVVVGVGLGVPLLVGYGLARALREDRPA